MFNEEDVLTLFESRLRPVLDGLGEAYEVLAVDDGSTDDTAGMLREKRLQWPELRVLRLRRNCGHQGALTAGLQRALGDVVVTIDADLQDPPEVIPSMLHAARREGVDVVYAVREDRSSDALLKRRTASLYYRVMRRAAGNHVPLDAGDFRLMSRAVVDELNSMPERHRVYRLLIPWLGYPSTTVAYSREKRAAGTSKYPVSKMTRLAVDSITSFTAMPLRIATWAGITGSILCLIAVFGAVAAQLAGATVPGWASVFVAVFFLAAIQLLCLGLLGEYVGRLYAEAQHRPLFLVASDSEEPPTSRPNDRPPTRSARTDRGSGQ